MYRNTRRWLPGCVVTTNEALPLESGITVKEKKKEEENPKVVVRKIDLRDYFVPIKIDPEFVYEEPIHVKPIEKTEIDPVQDEEKDLKVKVEDWKGQLRREIEDTKEDMRKTEMKMMAKHQGNLGLELLMG